MKGETSMQDYIMPANSKKSGLILGLFTPKDLVVLSIGVPISIILLIIFRGAGLLILMLAVIPGLTSILMVFPVPHYHNVMQLLINIFKYYSGRKKYEWRGWLKE